MGHPLSSSVVDSTEDYKKVSQDLPVRRVPPLPLEERRQGLDRRQRIFWSLLYGSFRPRRRGPRRGRALGLTDVDWHHPQWLAVGLLILLASVGDALLTLTLMFHGAIEVNPFMAVLLEGSGLGFATVKVGLTAMGTVFMILLAQAKAFRWIPVGGILYAVLAGYSVLIGYEVWLLNRISEL
jgi:hypothetical protein